MNSMKLSEILNKSSIINNLQSTVKQEVIVEFAQLLSGVVKAPCNEITDVLMERENLGSTGIGGGIAIPHGKLRTVKSITVGCGLSKNGVDYDSLDGKPVHIFFLLLTPENSTGDHLKVLAYISKLLKREEFKKRLKSAATNEQLYKIILDQDENF